MNWLDTTKFVLNIESQENWRVDCATNFSSLGFSDRRKKFFESLREHDVIITYVKAVGFVDVREIAIPGVLKLGIKGNYPEGAWPWQIRTRLIACLGLDRAVSPNEFPNTQLCEGEWRYRFQQSGRLIDRRDGETIAAAIVKFATI